MGSNGGNTGYHCVGEELELGNRGHSLNGVCPAGVCPTGQRRM